MFKSYVYLRNVSKKSISTRKMMNTHKFTKRSWYFKPSFDEATSGHSLYNRCAISTVVSYF